MDVLQPFLMGSRVGRFSRLIPVGICLVFAISAHAQTEIIGIEGAPGQPDIKLGLDYDDSEDIIGINYGPGRFVPDIDLRFLYIDNLTQEASAGGVDAFGTVVSPHFAYIISDPYKTFILDYDLEAGFFEGSSKDNYLHNRIKTGMLFQPTTRLSGSLNAEFQSSHDPRGTGRAEGGTAVTQSSIDEWHQWGILATGAYGRQDAIGRIEVEGGYVDKTYDTNTAVTNTRDRSELFGLARFHYRFMPKTFVVVEGEVTDHSYDNTGPFTTTLDSFETTVLAGVTWHATYKTTGFFKLGYTHKAYDSSVRPDDDGISWLAGVDWRPKTYSTVHIETQRKFEETNGTGDASLESYYLASWNHHWLDRFSTTLQVAYQFQEFTTTSREDDFYQAGLRANYRFRRWMDISAGYNFNMVDSNDDRFDYDQNMIQLLFHFQL